MRFRSGLWWLLAAMVTTLLVILVARIASLFVSIIGMFLKNATKHLGMVGLELWVMLTTEMLVIRFLLDFFGPWYAASCMMRVVLTIEMLNYSMVHYTMGLMQLSAEKVNDYFQVWAVLLVTLQYSVKIGRPYTGSKQIPLQDLVSSFWAANLIRVQTFVYLRISLWLMWALNAARIIAYFSASDKAEAINQESTRIVADYMSYEHELVDPQLPAADAAGGEAEGMKRYKYVVLGEDKVLKDLDPATQHARRRLQQEQLQAPTTRRRRRVLRLDPREDEKLITVDKIWEHVVVVAADADRGANNRRQRERDVCLSFALYKLLRRRFYHLPVHEAVLPGPANKIKRLVFGYILGDTERAFRVVATEVSFLQDMFYSKRAALFAAGFPAVNLALSLLLVAATGCVAHAAHYIPGRMMLMDDEAQAGRNKIIHGLFITRVIIALIIVKEVMEMYLYAFSEWTKVLLLCNYAAAAASAPAAGCRRHLHGVSRLVSSITMWVMLRLMRRGIIWDDKIRQQNLLASSRVIKLGWWMSLPSSSRGIKLEACTKEAIIESLKRLEHNPERLGSYLSNAMGSMELWWQYRWAADELEADTHRILVWHIATCLCEIQLYLTFPELFNETSAGAWSAVRKPKVQSQSQAQQQWVEHYTTACSLSNYCAYLVTQRLVPGSALVAEKVLGEVRRELISVIFSGRTVSLPVPRTRRYMQHVFTQFRFMEGGSSGSDSQTLTGKGARLASQLMDAHGHDVSILWEKLATFWTEFLLHLAATTEAAKHKTRLAGSRELVTHLWALLSHAGFLGSTRHGHLDPAEEPQQDFDPATSG